MENMSKTSLVFHGPEEADPRFLPTRWKAGTRIQRDLCNLFSVIIWGKTGFLTNEPSLLLQQPFTSYRKKEGRNGTRETL